MSDVLIKVEGVSKKFCSSLKRSLWYGMQDLGNELLGRRHGGNGELREEEFWAVKDVSFELKRGECLGLIGHNGAGKTTLLRMLNGLIKPDQGRIEMLGRVGALIALGAGFNPILTGRENIYVNASVLGLSKREINEKIDEIIDFAEIGEFIDSSVQSYSSGMQVRLGFAIAAALKPDVLLLDEVLAVGDTAFRAKCFQRIGKILSNTCVIFVSHDQNQIARICDQVMLVRKGEVAFYGPARDGMDIYRKSNSPTIKSQILRSSHVFGESLEAVKPVVLWGNDMEMLLKFYSEKICKVGLFLIHLYRDGLFVSHAEIDFSNKIIKSGENIWKITIKGNQFVAGVFHVSVSIFSEDKKSTILHMINSESFEIIGNGGYGPFFLQEAELEILSN
jgi:lipopolysaccharide transport system ATP-binding protein